MKITEQPTADQHTADWAVKNFSFSLKIKSGYWTPHGDFLPVPNGISRHQRDFREDGGWLVNLRNGHAIVYDHKHHHDYRKSLAEAVALRDAYAEELMQSRHVRRGRLSGSNTGHKGISYSVVRNRGKLYGQFSIKVGDMASTVGVGYQERISDSLYKRRLREAIIVRDKLEEVWRDRYRFETLLCQLNDRIKEVTT